MAYVVVAKYLGPNTRDRVQLLPLLQQPLGCVFERAHDERRHGRQPLKRVDEAEDTYIVMAYYSYGLI